jgi:protein Mpv17
MGFMERRSLDQIKEKFTDLYKPALVTNWQVWPIAQVRFVTTKPPLQA